MSRVKIPRPRDWASISNSVKIVIFCRLYFSKGLWMNAMVNLGTNSLRWRDKNGKSRAFGTFHSFLHLYKNILWNFDLPLLKEKLLENKHSSIIFIISQTESLFCYLVDSIKNFKLGGEDEGICHAKWHVKCKISPFSSSQVVFASVQTILQSPKESKSLVALNFAGKLAPIGTPKCRN